jgi:acyl transferase domain-containing protein/acyl carrier protein
MSDPLTSSAVKRALVELRDLHTRLDAAEAARHEPIAVIGIGCRLPGGVAGPDAFWDLLARGGDAIREVPPERWDLGEFFDPDPAAPGKMATRCGAFLDDIDAFDHGFFGISPREAASMDPQQRLVLEVAWEALEHAALAPDRIKGHAVGIFVGASATDYFQLLLRRDDPGLVDPYMVSGGSLSVIAGRLAYFLGAHGPALVVDTACSSSLVALHQACRSLRLRESEVAIAAGVSTLLIPELSVNFSQARMLSADGRCKTFDAAADGYGRSEGCGALVLKRLSDASAARDRVLAVIRGSAVNQDGRSSGLTVPNADAQYGVVRAALDDAQLAPTDVDYVEAHGTGTPLGDPIELRALARALGEGRAAHAPLLVGSVKTNLGHLEAAAGIVGVIKVVLALERDALPASLHFRTPNPHVSWSELPVRVVDRPMPWPDAARPRGAGVSSFGFSGTNAHVVLQAAPPAPEDACQLEPRSHVLALSARSGVALQALADRYLRHLHAHPGVDPADVCRTAAVGRAHFGVRLAVTGRALVELTDRLREAATAVEAAEAAPPTVAFAFAGQGTVHPGMGRELYRLSPVFRRAVDRCNRMLAQLSTPVAAVLVDGDGEVDDPARAQPSLFVLEYALAQLWQTWGVRPAAVVGHSLGEFTAACVAGAIDLGDALRLVAARGRLAASLPRGAMAAVFADEATVFEALGRAADVAIGALNGPSNTVISGTQDGVDRVCGVLAARGIGSRRLSISRSFHSPDVETMLDAFERECDGVLSRPPALAWASTVSGRVFAAAEAPAVPYWRQQAREPVRFAEAVSALEREGVTHYLEIGPNATLSALGRRMGQVPSTRWLPSLGEQSGEWDQLMATLARLYRDGAAIEWTHVTDGQPGSAIALPTYPFERHRHWMTGDRRRSALTAPDQESRWRQASAAAARQADAVPLDLQISGFDQKWSAMTALSLATMEGALGRLGAFAAAGESQSVASLLSSCGIVPAYRTLIGRWLGHLANAGRLERVGDRFVNLTAFDPAANPGMRAATASHFADYPEWLRYFDGCASRLDTVLQGHASPLDTLFPEGSTDLATGLYESSPVARYFNAIAAAAVATAAAAHRSGRPLRVLEIGGGTGGTTAALLPALDSGRTEYVFTDVGPWFLRRAEERFAAFSFVQYESLDIEGPDESWSARGGFDVVIAANVLHATRDLPATLGHVRRLLARGGILVAIETTDHPVWLDVTTGLISGWQRFADRWRAESPLLDVNGWLDALRDAGFGRGEAWPSAGSAAAILGQHVLVAQATDPSEPASAPSVVRTSIARRAPVAPVPVEAPNGDLNRLTEFVRGEVMAVLRLSADERPSRQQRLLDLGIDSLMAVELRDRLSKALGPEHTLPATLVFDYPTIGAIADYLAGATPPSVPSPDSRVSRGVLADRIADLDEQAVVDLVDARLRML